ncbi:MAG: acetyl-CoA decarbonylase/synthase complex subunit delta [Candidatus Heimdallarchaeota archaeon]|nr:acetyl-CoA decarbonylase/synthase complex subunit delta [Candidatus Heimdallarchaeota archaeon]
MNQEKLSFNGKVTEVKIGAGKKAITLGGQTSLPFLDLDNPPKLALHISDLGLLYPNGVSNSSQEYQDDLVEWAIFYERNYDFDALHINFNDIEIVRNSLPELIKKIPLPLIISGPGRKGDEQKILRLCGELTEGKNILLCSAELEDYKPIAATALAYNHSLVALSPIDVNIAKQLNILLTDFGIPLTKIVIDPMVAILGYGLEYTFSVMERIRSLALSGDWMLSSPMICFVQDSWRAREVSNEYPEWGSLAERGFLWEAMTAIAFFSAGADLLVFRHPKSLQLIKKYLGGG